MQRWGYGINGLYKSCHVHLEEGPWWAWWLQDVSMWLCDHIPQWKIPLIGRIRLARDGDEYTFAEWYGDDIHSLWHGFIDMPIIEWCWKHIKTTGVPLSWEECRRIFYASDPARWDEEEADPEFGSMADPPKPKGENGNDDLPPDEWIAQMMAEVGE